MRTRKLLLGLAVALLALGSWVGTAHAQEEGGEEGTEEHEFPDHESEECFEILEGGGSLDDCHEAPSPILPAADELFWSIVSFTVLALVLWKFAWPALSNGMEARSERIRESIEDAERAKNEAERVLSEYQSQLADARNEAARIIEEARQTADQLRRDLQQRAEADIAEMRQRASDEIQAAKDRALGELRGQVAELAIAAAERVVEQSLDPQTNRALVERFIEEVGSGKRRGQEQLTMADRVDAYAAALFEVARAEGGLGRFEEQLFAFSQAYQGSEELRSTLTDQRIPPARRQAIVEDILGDRADPAVVAFLSFLVAAGRARELPEIVARVISMAAEERGREVAEVRSAVPLDDDLRDRLADALGRATGKQVEVRVIIDPSVMGGVVAQVGDTVIDGSVRHRLEQLKSAALSSKGQ